jgi:hypothetical protein
MLKTVFRRHSVRVFTNDHREHELSGMPGTLPVPDSKSQVHYVPQCGHSFVIYCFTRDM